MSSITGNSENIFINGANLKIAGTGKSIIFSDGSVMTSAPPNADTLNTAYFSNAINAFVITETTANTGFAGNTNPQHAISVSSSLFISNTGNLTTLGQITAGSVANVESNILTLETKTTDISYSASTTTISGTLRGETLYGTSPQIKADANQNYLHVFSDGNNYSDSTNLIIRAIGGTEKAIFDNSNGRLGIGTTSPSATLHVVGNVNVGDQMYVTPTGLVGAGYVDGKFRTTIGSSWDHASIRDAYTAYTSNINASSDTKTWWTLTRQDTSAFHFYYKDNADEANYNTYPYVGTSEKGYLSNVGSGQINFTGQHRTFVSDVPFTATETNEGLIVSANKNDYIKMQDGITRGNTAITINESLPIVSLSNTMNDKRCFGVISGSEDPDKRVDASGIFHTNYEKEEGDTRIYINSVGEGAIWVSNIAGPLESGDYITTSNISGYGQRQSDDILHNYTVAKITMDCDFNPQLQPVKIIKTIPGTDENDLDEHGQIQWEDDPTETEYAYKIRYITADDGTIYKAAFVGCTYHCG